MKIKLIQNEVTFLANSLFSLNSTSDFQKDYKDNSNNINTLSYGMIELIHTLTSPPNYQILMNSLKLLSTNILDSNRFIKKLFTIFSYDKIFRNKDMVKKTILSKFSDETAELLYSQDKDFSIGKYIQKIILNFLLKNLFLDLIININSKI